MTAPALPMRVRPAADSIGNGHSLKNPVILCNFRPKSLIYKDAHATVSPRNATVLPQLAFWPPCRPYPFLFFFPFKIKEKEKESR
ncbi:hypothetical protein, partial [Ralstonia solanacearum species complex bacterium KE055]|uniref:hypothetical protein n=1 Tax=Ralstonia solanacearum species complex bacterium KE055 TaxID=3119586 RepID=UPI002FC3D0B6